MTATILSRLQADVHSLLVHVPALATANVLADDLGDIEAKVARALQTLDTGTGSKRGLAVVVMAAEIGEADGNLPGPQMLASIEVQIIEQVTLNRDPAAGTLIASATAAMIVLGALHHAHLGDLMLHAAADPIKTLPVKTGHVSHVVRLHCRLDSIALTGKPADVAAAITDGALVLTSATENAVIAWSRNGSFPAPGAPGCQVYRGPLSLAAGTVVRAAAYKAGLNPGNVVELEITE